MNFAFPAVLAFLLILPGFIFNLAFYKIENTPLKDISFTHKALFSSFIAVILHTIWLLIFYHFKCVANISLFLILISGAQGEKFAETLASISTHQIILTSIYLSTIYLVSFFFGKGLRWLIRWLKLDEKFNFFRIDSPWYYLFTGYDWNDGKPDGVRIAAILEIANKGYLYVGWLDKFFLDSNGNIDRLVLTSAMRRPIENDKETKIEDKALDRFYAIDGHYFVLRYAETKTINVQFIKLEEIE